MYPWLEKLVDKAKKKVSGHKPNLDDDVVPDPLIWSRNLEQHFYGNYSFAQVRGNENMEDRNTGHQTTFVGVYDGHGRHHASHLFDHLTRIVQENGTMSEACLRNAFTATEDGFLSIVQQNFGRDQRVAAIGSSCFVGVIWEDRLYVANLGDSRAVRGYLRTANKIAAEQLTNDHNTSRKDGHGGHHALHLFDHLTRIVQENGTMSEACLRNAFTATEDGFLSIVQQNFGRDQRVAAIGSCCLVGVIWEDILYVPNLGDYRAVRGYLHTANKIAAEQLTNDHNASRKEVRQELRAQHPEDPEIVFKRQVVWRVKGIIQVSRAIGDAYLKRPEFALDHCQLYLPKPAQRLYLPKPVQRPVLSADQPTSTQNKFLIVASSMFRKVKWMFNFIDLRDIWRKIPKSKPQKKSGRVIRRTIGYKPPLTPSLKPMSFFPSHEVFRRKCDIFTYKVRSFSRGSVRTESDENIGYFAMCLSDHPLVSFLGAHIYENCSTLSSFIEIILNRGLLEVVHGASGLFILIERDLLHVINRGRGRASGVIMYRLQTDLHARRFLIRPYQAIKVHSLYRCMVLGVGGCLDTFTNDEVVELINANHDATVTAQSIVNQAVGLNVGAMVITFN